MISTKQHLSEQWVEIPPTRIDEFWAMLGIWEPLIVNTQAEKDYFFAMSLMIGRKILCLLDGVDEAIPYIPPTYVKVDLSLL